MKIDYIFQALGVKREEEDQPQQYLVRAAFSSFSRPCHLEILVLPILFFFNVQPLQIKIFLENMATSAQK